MRHAPPPAFNRRRATRLALLSGLAVLLVAACGYPDPAVATGPAATTEETTPTPAGGTDDFNEGAGKTPVKFPDGLQIIDLKVGDGPVVPAGATVKVQYTGWLTSGKKFDSSRERNEPFETSLSAGQIIDGWAEGVPGMRVGGRRKLIIPPSLAYKDQAQGPIPANSTLVFTIEMLEITAQPTPTPTPSAASSPTPSR
jgi:FKBP-type peptidyl-prolyl cis-trans isomerase FkpA